MSTDAPPRALTPSQTVGPFFHDCLLRAGMLCDTLAGEDAAGQRIRVRGSVLDGDGVPVPDAILELWQADERGVYHHPVDPRWSRSDEVSGTSQVSGFFGFGRIGTDQDGRYTFTSILPGRVPCDGDHDQAPHISIAVFARGLLNHLFTRLYFPDEPSNETDAMLRNVPANRRHTLIARAETPASAGGPREYRFDIVLQGPDETVFFAMG